jgi:hypothetical protein
LSEDRTRFILIRDGVTKPLLPTLFADNKSYVFYTDLTHYGLHLLEYLHSNFIPYTPVIHNYNIIAIRINKHIFKCITLLLPVKLDIEGSEKDIFDTISNTYNCIKQDLQISLHDTKILSLGGVGFKYLNSKENNLFTPIPKNYENYIRNAYFGGRRELYCRGTFETLYYYDFPQMYGAVMCEELPLEGFEYIDLNLTQLNDIGAGFYDITINHPDS